MICGLKIPLPESLIYQVIVLALPSLQTFGMSLQHVKGKVLLLTYLCAVMPKSFKVALKINEWHTDKRGASALSILPISEWTRCKKLSFKKELQKMVNNVNFVSFWYLCFWWFQYLHPVNYLTWFWSQNTRQQLVRWVEYIDLLQSKSTPLFTPPP